MSLSPEHSPKNAQTEGATGRKGRRRGEGREHRAGGEQVMEGDHTFTVNLTIVPGVKNENCAKTPLLLLSLEKLKRFLKISVKVDMN